MSKKNNAREQNKTTPTTVNNSENLETHVDRIKKDIHTLKEDVVNGVGYLKKWAKAQRNMGK